MKKKITWMYLFFGTLSVALVGFVLYFSLTNVLISESVMSTESAVEQTGRYLEIYVEKLKIVSSMMTENQDVVEFFSHEGNQSDDFYESRINHLIESQMRANTSIKSIIIISKEGKLFSSEDKLDMSMSEDMMKEAWYQKAIHNEMPTLTSARMQPFSMDKDLWVISLSHEIVDGNGDNIGVAVIDVPYTAFETYLMDLHLGEGGFAYIVNAQQNVVFHKNKAYYEDDTLKASLIDLLNEPTGYQQGSSVLINHYDIQNTDWTLVAVSSVDTLLVLRRQVFETVLLGISIIFGVVIFTSAILKRLTEEIRSKEKDIHRYEMNAMYSQINPHFLYNTLDTIVWMAEFNQKEDIIRITKTLAQFFRLSLNKGEETTTLENEIEHVKQYLFIQKQRYQDKLDYEIDADKTVLDALVPKIILQPIVENAIYHGIKDMDDKGLIQIKAWADKEELIVTVTDNGIGFEHDNKDLPKSIKPKLGGVGLKNVDERMKLFCSEAYGLDIHSQLGKGTTVTLKLCLKSDRIQNEK